MSYRVSYINNCYVCTHITVIDITTTECALTLVLWFATLQVQLAWSHADQDHLGYNLHVSLRGT